MKECEEERTVFLLVEADNSISLGKCCLYQNLFSFKPEALLKSENIIKTVESTMNVIREIENFSPNQFSCNGKEACSWENFKLDSIKINVHGCNLKCEMCGSRKKEYIGANNFFTYFKLLEKVKGYKLKRLMLTCAGEPFIFKKKVMRYLKSLTLDDFQEVLIITNGTLIDEEDIKELAQLDVKIIIAVSNDAITKETYDKIRIGGNFEKVMQNIICLKKYNLLRQVSVVIQPLNIHEVPFIEEFWGKYDIPVHFIMVRGDFLNGNNFKEFRENLKKTNDENIKKFFENHKGEIE